MKPKSLRQTEFEDFYLPFGGRLKSANRWVVLAKKIPWGEFEELYATNFYSSARELRRSVCVLLWGL